MIHLTKVQKLISVLLSIAILFACMAACNKQDESGAEYEYYKQAQKYIDNGKYEKAKDIIEEGLENFSDSKLLSSLLEDVEVLLEGAENTESESKTESTLPVVPDIVGMYEQNAVDLLSALNVDTLVVYEENYSAYPGTVIYTDPSVGTVLDGSDSEDGIPSVIIYIAVEPEPVVTQPSKVTAQNASLVFNSQLYPAHTESKMTFTENPYVENGYLVMNFVYESTDGFDWNSVATVKVQNQILGASIESSDYHVESFTPYYFTVKVPVASLSNPYPYYLEMDFLVCGDHEMYINVTIVW